MKISNEEFIKRAKEIINYSKNDDIINIFNLIALPFKKEKNLSKIVNIKSPKQRIFEELFNQLKINYVFDKKIGFIILSKKRTKKTIVSHMDLIRKFNKGFSENNICKIEDNKLIGALDNTLTNAILINHIINHQSDDTNYLFTIDEETNKNSMKLYMKKYGAEQFIINLDITNDGWEHNMSIEYDEPSFDICKQIKKKLENPFLTKERVNDDLDEVLKANGYGFSYCLPTKNKIHSYENYTLIDKIKPYKEGLIILDEVIDYSNKEWNIEYLSIKKALKYKTLKRMKKKDIEKYKYIERTVEAYEIDDKDLLDNIATLVLDMSDKNGETILKLNQFLGFTLYSNERFAVYEFIDFANIEILEDLLALNIVKEIEIDEFIFNLDIVKSIDFQIYLRNKNFKTFNAFKFYKDTIKNNIYSFDNKDLLKYEKNKDSIIIADVINNLIQEKLISKKAGDLKYKIKSH